jgi:hypothetical protein
VNTLHDQDAGLQEGAMHRRARVLISLYGKIIYSNKRNPLFHQVIRPVLCKVDIVLMKGGGQQ